MRHALLVQAFASLVLAKRGKQEVIVGANVATLSTQEEEFIKVVSPSGTATQQIHIQDIVSGTGQMSTGFMKNESGKLVNLTQSDDEDDYMAKLQYPNDPTKKYYQPNETSYDGKWLNEKGILIDCNTSHCFVDMKYKPLVINQKGALLLADTMWEGRAISDLGARWMKAAEAETFVDFWDRLPDPTGFKKFAETGTYWIDSHGNEFKVLGDDVCFRDWKSRDFADCKPLTIKDGVVKYTRSGRDWAEDWILVDFYERDSEYQEAGSEWQAMANQTSQTFAAVHGKHREMRWRCKSEADQFVAGDLIATEVQEFHPTQWDIGNRNHVVYWMDCFGQTFECTHKKCTMVAAPDLNYYDPNEGVRTYSKSIERIKKREKFKLQAQDSGSNKTDKKPAHAPMGMNFHKQLMDVLGEMKGGRLLAMKTFSPGTKDKRKVLFMSEDIDYDGLGTIHWRQWDVRTEELEKKDGDPKYAVLSIWHRLPLDPTFVKKKILTNAWFTNRGEYLVPSGTSLLDTNGEFWAVDLVGPVNRDRGATRAKPILKVGPYVVSSFDERKKGQLKYFEVILSKPKKQKDLYKAYGGDQRKSAFTNGGFVHTKTWRLYQAGQFSETEELQKKTVTKEDVEAEGTRIKAEKRVAEQAKLKLMAELEPAPDPYPVQDDDELALEGEGDQKGFYWGNVVTLLSGVLFALIFAFCFIMAMGSTKSRMNRKLSSQARNSRSSRRSAATPALDTESARKSAAQESPEAAAAREFAAEEAAAESPEAAARKEFLQKQ